MFRQQYHPTETNLVLPRGIMSILREEDPSLSKKISLSNLVWSLALSTVLSTGIEVYISKQIVNTIPTEEKIEQTEDYQISTNSQYPSYNSR